VRQAMIDFVQQRCRALDALARAGNGAGGRR
jgi:hypothetical protein